MNAALITIGDEILIGQIVDTNAAWIGQQLNSHGVTLSQILTVGDQQEEIKKAIRKSFDVAPLLILTGGLGPTKDDVTKKAICEYFGVETVFHQYSYDRIARIFEKRGLRITKAHEAQCYMPENAELLRNSMGTAPGLWMEHEGKILLSVPGVPFEMKAIMGEYGFPRIIEYFKPSQILRHITIHTVGEGEARLSQKVERLTEALPSGMSVAFLPGLGQVRLRISHTGFDEQSVLKALDLYAKRMADALGDIVYSIEAKALEQVLGDLCLHKNVQIATAESCTGGYLAHKITSISGSSAYFKGAVVSYSNELKQKLLKVKAETLDKYGAVSKETVLEMLDGLLISTGADIGISISGIAGPGGGTKNKPVGTVHFAWGDAKNKHHTELLFGKDRLKNIELASVFALNMLRKYIMAM